MDLRDKNVLVIGAATTGIPTVKTLCSLGARVTLTDSKPQAELEALRTQFGNTEVRIVGGGHPLTLLEGCDFIVISPGVPTDLPFVCTARANGIEVISEIELAYRLTNTEIAAITGTNGKTTTTSLLGEIMKAAGRTTYVTGNIGSAMIAKVEQAKKEDIFVVEVSSFQLESTIHFRPHVSAILNITPDHLNRHKTMENYIDAKCRVFACQTEEDYTILNLDDEGTAKLIDRPKAKVLLFSHRQVVEQGAFVRNGKIVIRLEEREEEIIDVDRIFIPGKHNLENALAAALMAYVMGAKAEVIAKVLEEFRGVEHRIEYVAEVDGVVFYNDSKGTNTDAAIKAIEAMTRPTILIAGGYDKGVSFDDFVEAFGDRVKDLVLIGVTANQIEQTARTKGFTHIHREDTLEDALTCCRALARPGDCVLLSPACASWDMFQSYEARGRLFKEIVQGFIQNRQ